jgi:hypothetical protein
MMRNRQVYLTPAEVIVVLKAAKERSARLDDDFARLSSWMPRQRDLQPATDDVDLKRQAITIRRLKGSMDTVQPLYPHRGVLLVDELAALRAYLRHREADRFGFPVRQPKGRQVTSQPILSLVPGDRSGRGLAAGQTTPARL